MPQGEVLPGQSVHDHFLSAQFGQRRIRVHANAHKRPPWRKYHPIAYKPLASARSREIWRTVGVSRLVVGRIGDVGDIDDIGGISGIAPAGLRRAVRLHLNMIKTGAGRFGRPFFRRCS